MGIADTLTYDQLDKAIEHARHQNAPESLLVQLQDLRARAFARSSDRPRKPHWAEIRDVRVSNRGIDAA